MRTLLTFALISALASLFAQPAINLELVASVPLPVDITHAGDDRLFIVERSGYIHILDGNGELLDEPFLDIDNRVSPANGERGLLGLTFHPDYENNGYFFVNYTGNGGDTHISRFQVDSGNPNEADPNSEVVLMKIDQPYDNHNAGDLNFGPDGYLYIAMGDGGSGGDPQNYSQNRQSLLGKMLRIDVDNGDPYSIPEDNPFAFDDFTLDEVWAIGLRNPWRFSFDRETGDIWIGDVGQSSWEEVSYQPADSEGGENYGWRCYEGFEAYNTDGCEPESNYTPPVFTYNTGSEAGCSITGGVVYRGSDFPAIYGKYIYSDFCSGKMWALEKEFGGDWVNTEIYDGPGGQYVAFGEDNDGELYVAAMNNGAVYRIEATCNQLPAAPVIEGEALICNPGDPVLLEVADAPDGYVYRWYRDSTFLQETLNGVLEVTQPGEYHVVLSTFEAGNCNSPVSQGLVVTTADFPSELIVSEGDSLAAPEGFAAYQWYLDDELIEGATSPTYVPTESGAYTVEVTDENGCTRLSEELALVNTILDVGLSSVQATPNPFSDQLNLRLEAHQPADYMLRLITIDGKMVWEQEVDVRSTWQSDMDMGQWPQGVYLLQISRNGVQYTKRLIKGK